MGFEFVFLSHCPTPGKKVQSTWAVLGLDEKPAVIFSLEHELKRGGECKSLVEENFGQITG